MKTSTLFFVFMTGHFSFAQPSMTLPTDALIISEVFPDPTPSYGLPELEYIELFNSGPDTLQLKGLSISDPDKTCILPSFMLYPFSYLILCKSADVAAFKSYGHVLGLSSMLSLNNDGDEVYLKSPSGKVISQLDYVGADYIPGKSIEYKYDHTFCTHVSDFDVSAAPSGGTPGTQNSVFQTIDPSVPALKGVTQSSDTTLELNFTISLQQPSDQNHSYFQIDSGTYQCRPESYLAKTKTLVLSLDRPLLGGGYYTLNISGLRTCLVETLPDIDFVFLKTEKADSSDIVINELLFNPYPGCNDFIELYNTSAKYLDLQNFQLAKWQNGAIANMKKISSTQLVIAPKAYLALTPDKIQLVQKYPKATADNIFQAILPSWNDDAGNAIVLLPDGKVGDVFAYADDFHLPLLVNKQGISLERISATASASSKDNWHSAAAGHGFATPGTPNSVMFSPAVVEGWNIDPLSFSPDGDGYKDFVAINYSLPASQIASVTVFDVQGRQVKKLANNLTLASEGFIQWDGSLDDASLARAGYYVVYISTFDTNGRVHEEKKPIAVTFKD